MKKKEEYIIFTGSLIIIVLAICLFSVIVKNLQDQKQKTLEINKLKDSLEKVYYSKQLENYNFEHSKIQQK